LLGQALLARLPGGGLLVVSHGVILRGQAGRRRQVGKALDRASQLFRFGALAYPSSRAVVSAAADVCCTSTSQRERQGVFEQLVSR
jgi:hypothetical protein